MNAPCNSVSSIHLPLALILISFCSFGSAALLGEGGSVPVRATIQPAVADRTSPLDPTAVAVGGLLGDRILAHTSGRILHIDEEVLLGGFRERPGSHPWIGEHVGKWLHAASLLWLHRPDPDLQAKLTRVARGLIATQGEDGYLGTYVLERRLGLYPGEAWDERSRHDSDWDVWVHKYGLIGLLSYHGITDDEAALTAACRAADLLVSTFPRQRSILIAGTHAGMAPTSVLEPIVLLYRVTGEQRYLDFARYIVRSWDEPRGPQVLSAMLRDKTVLAVGNRKAYEMLSNYVGLCELYRATGESMFLTAATHAWEDVNANRLYITGGSSAGEHFQPDGQFPNHAAANIQETCVTTTWIQLGWQLLRLTGEEKYAAAIEQALFNQTLGAQKPDGSGFGYYIPLEGRKPFQPHSPGTRGMDCCNSSGPRALGLAPTVLGTTDAEGFRIHTFSPALWRVTRDGVPVSIQLESRFPADGEGVIRIDPERDTTFRLALRIPRWTSDATVTMDDKKRVASPGTYLEITRAWQRGDVVRFSFPFEPVVHIGSGSKEGRVAVTAGPLVLALDTADNPDIEFPWHVALDGLSPDSLGFAKVPATGNRSWPDQTHWSCNLVHLVAVARGREARLRGVLRPFLDAGSWNATQYAVWLRAPGTVLEGNAIGPFTFGRELYSRPGNVDGSIADGDIDSFRVTYDGRPQEEAWFGIQIDRPVWIHSAVYVAGRLFHDGGWFDTTAGKPRFQVRTTADAPWIDIAVFDDYPNATGTDPKGIRQGMRFSTTFDPVQAVAIRVIGRPASGDNPGQAFASCAELIAVATTTPSTRRDAGPG
jgi:uncharacterized protein